MESFLGNIRLESFVWDLGDRAPDDGETRAREPTSQWWWNPGRLPLDRDLQVFG